VPNKRNAVNCIHPAWPAPANIIAGCTTRTGGTSSPPYDTLNLGLHVSDKAEAVNQNREQLHNYCVQLADSNTSAISWQWLNQTHSTRTHRLKHTTPTTIDADACVSTTAFQVCTVLTADCLPILLCDENGSTVAAIHAGWRGLANGIVESAVGVFRQSVRAVTNNHNCIYAWLGPAIGANQFEVGSEVRTAFLSSSFLSATKKAEHFRAACEQAFTAQGNGKYLADIYQLATIALRQCDIHSIYGGGFCTVSEPDRFFSYRRDGNTGRMASFIFKV
jgi:hypothetical protein